MVLKEVLLVVLFIALAFFVGIYYDIFPEDAIELIGEKVNPEPINTINYGNTPVFEENMRFNHNNISYFIDENCENKRRDSITLAFDIFEKEMGIISFYELKNKGLSDIKVMCSEKNSNTNEGLFTAGEGGPSKFIDGDEFKTIEEGEIFLYKDSLCDYPNVEIHELGHVFGFDHSPDPKNIMYNISNCEQRITPDMVDIIYDLYSINPLGDASIENIVAIKRGRYLDFNITISNEGLIDIDGLNLTLISEEEEILNREVGYIAIGHGVILMYTDVLLPSLNANEISFFLDINNEVEELNEDNNFLKVSATSQ